MKKKFIFSLFAMISVHLFSFTQEYSINGRIVDKEGKPVEFANVIAKDQSNKIVEGTIADTLGFFKLKAMKGTYAINISFLGYEDWSKKI